MGTIFFRKNYISNTVRTSWGVDVNFESSFRGDNSIVIIVIQIRDMVPLGVIQT